MAFCWRADSGPRQFTDWEASEECVMCSYSHEQTHVLYFCYTSYLFVGLRLLQFLKIVFCQLASCARYVSLSKKSSCTFILSLPC